MRIIYFACSGSFFLPTARPSTTFPFLQVFGDDLAGGVGADFCVGHFFAVFLLDADHGLGIDQADLARDGDLHVLDAAFVEFVEHGGHHLTRAGGDAAGAHAEHDAVLLVAFTQRDLPLRLFLEFLEFVEVHRISLPVN